MEKLNAEELELLYNLIVIGKEIYEIYDKLHDLEVNISLLTKNLLLTIYEIIANSVVNENIKVVNLNNNSNSVLNITNKIAANIVGINA